MLPSQTLSLSSGSDFEPHSGESTVGQPIYFITGPHSGKTIRMKLVEIQKADIGRKYGKADRRPLDPPPVVLLKIYETQTGPHGEKIEVEVTYDETHLFGMLCTVDLFPAPDPSSWTARGGGDSGKSLLHTGMTYKSMTRTRTLSPTSSSSSSSSARSRYQSSGEFYQQNSDMFSPVQSVSGSLYPSEGPSDIIHALDGFTFTEDSKQTSALVGGRFVQPEIIDYQGSKAIVFVLSDLASKIEGIQFLRYRVFDIFGRQPDEEIGITAETHGGTFKVYSANNFPGLQASTELTKYLSKWGMRLNVRESQRGGRKPTVTRKFD